MVGVEVKALKKDFYLGKQKVEVLKGVDLQVRSGETVAVLGASGAGKSTLLHILGTLDRPSSGEIKILGSPPPFERDAELSLYRNQTIGFVFQFHHLLGEFSALENTMIPCLIAQIPKSEARQKAEYLLNQVGLGQRLKHRPGELSGGEQQRVALARALVMQPKVLLADEPTGNLDRKTSESIHELLTQLNKKLETTMILATHNQHLADQMERCVVLEDGIIRVG